MKKNVIILLMVISSSVAFSQVNTGINTTTPMATLDVTAKEPTGTATDADGLLVPRVDRERAQSMTGVEASTLIYVNSVSTGTQTGTAVNIDTEGYYYFDGSAWIKLNLSSGTNIYNSDGTLTGDRLVTQGANTLSFTGTSTNAFSVDGNTLSVDAANNRVGIGTDAPANALHVSAAADPLKLDGIVAGNEATDQLLAVDSDGVVKSIGTLGQLSIPTPAIFRLGTAQGNFLNGIGVGGSQVVPMSMIKNEIPGLSYNEVTSTITFPAGTYQMVFVYEATHNNTGCTISSYFVDFPLNAAMTRIHSTVAYTSPSLSNHGGSVTYVTTVNAGRTWQIRLGRGQSGNCTGPNMNLTALSTQLLIFRIGD